MPGLTGVSAIAAGHSHTLVRRQDGTRWSWGHNAYDQPENGTTTSSASPVQVTSF